MLVNLARAHINEHGDVNAYIVQNDLLTEAPLSISTDHNYIHRGKAYTLSGKSGSVASAGTFIISFQTPADKYVHMRPAVIASTANIGEMRIADGSTFSGGSAATAYNRNCESANVTGSTLKTGVTMTVEGAIKHYFTMGTGGNPSQSSGGGSGESNEIVLKRNTTYTLRFENIGATTATVFYFNIFWYEEDGGII